MRTLLLPDVALRERRRDERVARARAAWPDAFVGGEPTPPPRVVGASAWQHPVWLDHVVPPDQTLPQLVRRAVAHATADWNRTHGTTYTPTTILARDEAESCEIGRVASGPIKATLVNTVMKSPLTGPGFYLPWTEEEETLSASSTSDLLAPPPVGTKGPAAHEVVRREAIAPLLLQQALLGISTRMEQTTLSTQFRISYCAPFRCNHDIFPLQLKVQETAAMSDDMGAFALCVTIALMRLAARLPTLAVHARRCENCVYVAYMPFRLDVPRLLAANPGCSTRATRFGGTVIEHPMIGRIRFIVFPTGCVICVGAKCRDDMQRAMIFFLPRLVDAASMVSRTAGTWGPGGGGGTTTPRPKKKAAAPRKTATKKRTHGQMTTVGERGSSVHLI